MSNTWKLGVKIAVLLPVILVGIFTSPTFAATYTASISTSTSLSIDASSVGNGTSVGVDNLTVTSTCPSGYNVTIEGPSDTNLYLNGDSSNNASGTYIAHSTGTSSNPATITGANKGTWGYSTTSSTGSGTFIGLTNTATNLFTKSSASSSGGDSIPVYYGVSIPDGLAPGIYRMPGTSAITYYLTRSDNCVSYSVSFNANGGSGTTMANQRIYEDVATPLSANTYTAPTGKIFKEWNTAADGTGTSYTDEESVTNIATVGTTLPLYAIWENENNALYDKVAEMSKGTQTNDDNATTGIQATIVTPTESNPISSNSGVYEYNDSVFGADSDATKSDGTKAKIYYYRGILDSYGNTGSYGSDGLADAYPNYVILQSGGSKVATDTCWRIVRTTGSGGVKMIYNGTWTGSTCANSTTAAQIRSTATITAGDTSTFTALFNPSFIPTEQYSRSIISVGYTYNANYKTTSSNTAYSTLFGSNTSYSGNSTSSTIKAYVETWFANNLDSYSSILEPSAGYCNDRSIRSSSSSTSVIADDTSISVPFTVSNNSSLTAYYFGPYVRNTKTSDKLTLNCPRNNADLYTTSSADSGNKQLDKPAALLTADEMQFAGSGRSTASQGSSHHANSFLRSGSTFWSLSPSYREATSGLAYGFYLNSNGYLTNSYSSSLAGVRPSISLEEGTEVSSGSGTATDPWVIKSSPDPIPCNTNKICYSENTLKNDVVGTMGQQDANASTEKMLLASNFSREGYGFAGWNTEPDYSGTFYGPSETITTPSDMSSGLSLYAVWVKSRGYLQDANKVSSVCSKLTTAPTDGTANLSSVSALTDQRDNETYAIAKLADGNCWMIENLRLDNTNSDNSTGALSQGYASGFIGLADPEAPWAENSTTANSLYSTDGSTTVTISGSNKAYRMPRYNNVNTPSSASDRPQNPTTNYATNSTSNASMYSYGNYYTWTAASTDISETSTSDYNTKSICPTGWSIPRGGNKSKESTNDFWTYIVTNLNNGVNPANYEDSNVPFYANTGEAKSVANALRSYPNNFVYSGYITSGSLYRGEGRYHSSSTVNAEKDYTLSIGDAIVNPGTNAYSKYIGQTVRCFVAPSS